METNLDLIVPPKQSDDRSQQQIIRTIILFGLAIYFAYNILTGNLANYINARFVWLSYVAVVLFAVLGLSSLYKLYRGDDHHDHDHHHDHVTWPIILVVAIPLVLGTLIPSKPLGAEAVNGNITFSVANVSSGNVLSKGPLARNVLDWLRLFSSDSTPSAFNGEPADLIGFVYREPGFPPNHFMVARFTLSCCVADAGAIGVPVYWEDTDTLTDGEWVRIQGEFQGGTFRNAQMPILQVQVLDVVEQPEHPYLYP